MQPDPCPECGKNRNMVGRVHKCVPVLVEVHPEIHKMLVEASAPAEPKKVRAVEQAVRDRAAKKSRAPSALSGATGATKTGAARNKRWRESHPEAHREYMRGYMQRKRAGSGDAGTKI